MAAEPSTHHLDVPGAQLYYEVRGSGPLLLVVGQPMTSAWFSPLADLLAADNTVVTYDPRGLGQSTVDDPSLDVTPEIEADDLAWLVDAVGGGAANVFGSSGGAVAGLAFATGHPGKVGTLVAHEPPVVQLLPDAPHVHAAVGGIEDAYRAAGAGAASQKFVSLVMHDGPVTEEGVPPVAWPPEGQGGAGAEDAGSGEPPPAPSEKQRADEELFYLRMLRPFLRYEPQLDSLRLGRPDVVVAVGEASRREVARRSAVALAEQLGTSPAVFPGDHGGFMTDPAAFADALRQVLTRTV